MARYSKAVWKPMPEAESEPRITATQVILHSAVSGAASLYGFFSRDDVTLESHFYVNQTGVEQYQNTSRQADANRDANVRAISIESWDNGDPNRVRWTPTQLDLLVDLVTWCCRTHNIPARQCPAWDQPGIGWHSMWGAPSHWTPSAGKTCPGTARIPQIPDLIKRVQQQLAGEEDYMEPADIAKGVELAVKPASSASGSGVARDDFKSLIIGSFLDGIRDPDGDIRPELIEVIREAVEPLLAPAPTDEG